MTAELRLFSGITTENHDPDVMLRLAQGHLADCVILGWDKDGELFFSSNIADGGSVLWLLKKAEMALIDIDG